MCNPGVRESINEGAHKMEVGGMHTARHTRRGGEHSIDNYKHESLLAATLPQLTVWNTGLLFS